MWAVEHEGSLVSGSMFWDRWTAWTFQMEDSGFPLEVSSMQSGQERNAAIAKLRRWGYRVIKVTVTKGWGP